MTGTWQDFRGIDALSGFKRVVGEVVLRNELGGVSDGYELVHVRDSHSGYSFGGNQLDVAHNKHAVDILRDIILHSGALTDGVAFFEGVRLLVHKKGDPYALNAAQQEQINHCLRSTYGKKRLNEDFVQEIDRLVAHVESVIKQILAKPSVDEKIKLVLSDSEEIRIYLADYHNQFHLNYQGKMQHFLEGKPVTMHGGFVLQLDGFLAVSDIEHFVCHTKEYQDNPKGVRGRLQRIAECLRDKQVS